MKVTRAISFCVAIALAALPPIIVGQEVHVTSDKGIVTMSVAAQKAYSVIASGQAKTPVLSVTCQQKGKKIAHMITLSPGGILTEQEYSTFGSSATLVLETTAGDHTQATTWVSHSGLQSFDYVGKTEPERVQFLQTLLSVPSVTIRFTPFLTGTPTSSTFDLTGLRTEFEKHPECAIK